MDLLTFLTACLLRTCTRCAKHSSRPICDACALRTATRFTTQLGIKVCSLGLYEGAPGDLVRRLKYEEETIYARHLGYALGQLLPEHWTASLLLPVPLHPRRLAERGYNQAALLARAIASSRQLPFSTEVLRRTRNTAPQAQLERKARADNLQHAFEAKKGSGPVILIDDVVTTGHTIDACARALETAGYSVIGVLSCALARAHETLE